MSAGSGSIESVTLHIGFDGKAVTMGLKRLDNGVKKFSANVTKLLAPIADKFAPGRLFSDFIDTRKLEYLSDRLDVNVDELSAWSKAVQNAGGSAESLQATLSNFATDFRFAGNGKSPIDTLLELADLADSMDKRQFIIRAKQFGIDDGLINLLMKGREEVERLVAQQRNFAVSDGQAESARRIYEAYDRLDNAVGSVANATFTRLEPAITFVLDSLTSIISYLSESTVASYAFSAALVAVSALEFVGVVSTIYDIGKAFIKNSKSIKVFGKILKSVMKTVGVVDVNAGGRLVSGFKAAIAVAGKFGGALASVAGTALAAGGIAAIGYLIADDIYTGLMGGESNTRKFLDFLKAEFPATYAVLSKANNAFWDLITSGIDLVIEKVASSFSSIADAARKIWDEVAFVAGKAWGKIVEGVDFVVGKVTSSFSTLADAAGKEWDRFAEKANAVIDFTFGEGTVDEISDLAFDAFVKPFDDGIDKGLAQIFGNAFQFYGELLGIGAYQKAGNTTASTDVSIQTININTQATDAASIAGSIGESLNQTITNQAAFVYRGN